MNRRRASDPPQTSRSPYGDLPAPRLVTTTDQLQALLPDLLAAPLVAVDTEANSLFAYFHKVCLIQISTADIDIIVDPLSVDLDARLLDEFFASPHVQKIFHAAENDVLILKRDYGFEFTNLFDTLWAARVLGWPEVGLGAILEKRFGVHMNKRMQRANWGKRPLTREQLAYARLDTHYLIGLRAILYQELETSGRLAEAQEVFDELPAIAYVHRPFDPDGFWRMRGARDLASAEQAALQALYLWREEKARSMDRPPFKVLSDHVLVSLAQKHPASAQEIAHTSGVNRSLGQRFGGELLHALQAAYTGPPPTLPRRNNNHVGRPDEETSARYEALRAWRTARAAAREVDPDVVMTNDTLMTIARQAPTSVVELETCPGFGPTKHHLYGEEIVAVLRGLANS